MLASGGIAEKASADDDVVVAGVEVLSSLKANANVVSAFAAVKSVCPDRSVLITGRV